MSEPKSKNLEQLTIKPVHFPPVVIATAAALWSLALLGTILEIAL